MLATRTEHLTAIFQALRSRRPNRLKICTKCSDKNTNITAVPILVNKLYCWYNSGIERKTQLINSKEKYMRINQFLPTILEKMLFGRKRFRFDFQCTQRARVKSIERHSSDFSPFLALKWSNFLHFLIKMIFAQVGRVIYTWIRVPNFQGEAKFESMDRIGGQSKPTPNYKK